MSKTPELSGSPPIVEPRPDWSSQEKWVWSKVRDGEIADFNEGKDYGGHLDPKDLDRWPESRVLTSSFIETILLSEPYRDSVPRHGVNITGAWFRDNIDLFNATISTLLALDGSRFDSEVTLQMLKSPYSISINGSTFAGMLDMVSLQLDGNLFMSKGAKFKEVVIRNAKIGGQLTMTGSTFSGMLNMNNLQVNEHLFMSEGAKFEEVNLGSAKMGGQLDMNGSTFSGMLDMDKLKVASSLFMREGAEFKDVNLGSAKIGGQLDMTGSTFKGRLNMDNLQVNGHLLMHEGAEFKEVDLRNAKIGGHLDMTGTTFKGRLNMDNLQVDGQLFMNDGAKFKEVVIRNAKIGGQLTMTGSTLSSLLNMSGMRAGHLFMHDGAKFEEVNLLGAKIGGQLAMDDSIFSGKLTMESLHVGEHLYMRDVEFTKPVNMIFAKVFKGLDVSDSTFPSMDLTGAEIKGELCLGSGEYPPAKWASGAKLILRNTKAGALQDLEDAWPDELELDGFTYAALGGYATGESGSMAERDIKWLLVWLKKQKRHTPQPYEQLAKVLRESGHKDKSREILYACKEEERKNAKKNNNWLEYCKLSLLSLFVGHGYRFRLTAIWVGIFTTVGVLVLQFGGQGSVNHMPYGISFSLDMLLPIIKLNEAHYEIELSGLTKYYFYFQKLMGYFLATMLGLGLTSMAKK